MRTVGNATLELQTISVGGVDSAFGERDRVARLQFGGIDASRCFPSGFLGSTIGPVGPGKTVDVVHLPGARRNGAREQKEVQAHHALRGKNATEVMPVDRGDRHSPLMSHAGSHLEQDHEDSTPGRAVMRVTPGLHFLSDSFG